MFFRVKKKYIYITAVLLLLLLLTYEISDSVILLFQDEFFGRCTSKKIFAPPDGLDRDCKCRSIPMNRSFISTENYCSDYSTTRGSGQKVISYSFYGEYHSKYLYGVESNIYGVKKYYPGYIMRIYHNLKAPILSSDVGRELCKLYCREPMLDLCNVHYIDWYPNLSEYFGMLWRYTPMSDPLVSEWHSRDLDSRISLREIKAVEDWDRSGKTYHIMRDNPAHHFYIMGGCFGMKMKSDMLSHVKNDFEKMLLRSRKVWKKWLDQDLLAKYVWPRAKLDMVAHDSYLCNSFFFRHPSNRPFPTKRLEGRGIWNFVGSNGENLQLKVRGPCPKACRPKDHQDWIIC